MQTHLLDDKASLSKLRRLIRGDLVKAGASPGAVFDCLVAVSEACADAIGPDDSLRPARVSWWVIRSEARFVVEGEVSDETSGEVGRQLAGVVDEDSSLAGLGDDVISSLMDEVRLEENPDGKRLVMVKRLR